MVNKQRIEDMLQTLNTVFIAGYADHDNLRKVYERDRYSASEIIEALQAEVNFLTLERNRIRGIVDEVASCGISYDAKKYIEVQIDSDLWADIQDIKGLDIE